MQKEKNKWQRPLMGIGLGIGFLLLAHWYYPGTEPIAMMCIVMVFCLLYLYRSSYRLLWFTLLGLGVALANLYSSEPPSMLSAIIFNVFTGAYALVIVTIVAVVFDITTFIRSRHLPQPPKE